MTTLESQMKVPLVIKVPRPQFWFAVLLRYPNESTASPNLVCGTIGGTLGSNSVAAVVKACIVMKYLYTITSYSFGAFIGQSWSLSCINDVYKILAIVCPLPLCLQWCNEDWTTAVAGEADNEVTCISLSCHSSGPI